MNAPPTALLTEFTQTLQAREITGGLHRHSLKWFRDYWDFCAKYQLDPRQAASLNSFLEKLKAKNQTAGQQAEAKQAIELFLHMCGNQKGRSGDKLTSNEVEMMQVASAGHEFEVRLSLPEPKGENRQIAKVAASEEVFKQITDSNPIFSAE